MPLRRRRERGTTRVTQLKRAFSRELGTVGAAAGAAAAAPVVGTAASLGTAAAELGWFTL